MTSFAKRANARDPDTNATKGVHLQPSTALRVTADLPIPRELLAPSSSRR
jgi:hypothetical protein